LFTEDLLSRLAFLFITRSDKISEILSREHIMESNNKNVSRGFTDAFVSILQMASSRRHSSFNTKNTSLLSNLFDNFQSINKFFGLLGVDQNSSLSLSFLLNFLSSNRHSFLNESNRHTNKFKRIAASIINFLNTSKDRNFSDLFIAFDKHSTDFVVFIFRIDIFVQQITV